MAWVPRKSHGLMRLALLHEDDQDDSATASPRGGSGGGVHGRDVGSPLPSIGDMVRHAAARNGNGDRVEEQDVVGDSQDDGNAEQADAQVEEQAGGQAEEQAVQEEEDPIERWLQQRRRNRVNAQPSGDDESDHEGQNDENEAEMGHLDRMIQDDSDNEGDSNDGDDRGDGDGHGDHDDRDDDGNYSFAGSQSDHDERDQFHDDFALDAPDDDGEDDDDAGDDDADINGGADGADIADAEENGGDAQAPADGRNADPWNPLGDRPLMATRLPGGGGFGGLGGFAGFGALGGAFANIAGMARRRGGADYGGGEALFHQLNGALLQPRNLRFREQDEIDLTALSSDSEDGGNGENNTGNEDDDVEIVGISAPAAGGGSNAAGPRSRKRRRPNNNTATAAAPPPFDTKSADSTNISMENNETIERFKKALKCSVCLDVIQDMTSTMCGHVYCGHCIKLAIRVTGKCPLCQRPLRPTDIHGLFF